MKAAFALLSMIGTLLPGAVAAAESAAADLIREGIPEAPAALKERLRQYQNTRAARFAGFTIAGDEILILTRFGQTDQVHLVAEPMGARQQLTFFDEPIADAVPSPNDSAVLAFLKDVGGAEDYQVFVFDRRTGESRMVSDGAGRKTWPMWSPDGKRLAWSTTLEAGLHGITILDLDANARPQTVFRGTGSWFPIAWSPSGTSLLLYHFMAFDDSEIHLLDPKSGALREINPSVEPVGYGRVAFAADGHSLYLVTDQSSQALTLFLYDIASGAKRRLTEQAPWDVEYVAASPAGSSYAFVVNHEGRSQLHLRRTEDNAELPVPPLPPGVISDLAFSPGGGRLALTLNASDSPGDVWMLNLGSDPLEWQRWTASEVGGLNREGFVAPEFFRYPTFDMEDGETRMIPAFLYRPEGDGPHPVVISIHGGPSYQARPTFSPEYQFWARELGAAVIVPNVRGSTGFGKVYQQLDDQRRREDSVKDIGALLDWIAERPDLDEERVVVHGSSYGGYMVLAALVHFGKRLAGGVDIVGISNFVTFLESTAEYRRGVRRPEYGDERDPDMRAFLGAISPLNRADEIRVPLLIVQGLNDPRVPASEAEQILDAVRKHGVDAWYLAARDEGHGFRKKANVDSMIEAVALFMQTVFD
jgi:dipeptidyl aminopeptidase/acylaminoacyl peptidase